jgi:hypothetical protein
MPPVDKSALPVMVTTVLSLLSNTAAVGAPVLDYVPRSQAFPYVRLEGGHEINDGSMGQPGKTVWLEAHVFTSDEQDLGTSKATGILSKIRELTYFPTIAPTADFECRGMWVEDVTDAGTEIDAGRTITHHIARIRAWWMPAGS